jgi:outer membrane protein OmpA-like peptidoglycan-associated protein
VRGLFFLSWVFLVSPPLLLAQTGARSSGTRTVGASRCSVPHCLCAVRPDPTPPRHSETTPPNIVTDDRLVIYFDEDQSNLDAGDRSDLERFLSRNPGARDFSVTGHADVCGNPDYNLRLGATRADHVADFLSGRRAGVRTRTSSVGESSAATHHEFYRKVEITTSTGGRGASNRPAGWLSARLSECRGDFYLLDGSGSMAPYWADVVSHRFPASARVYLSIMSGCSNGASLTRITPNSGTEIWYSYWKILDEMRPGQTLCIASDFVANFALTQSEYRTIEDKVREKGVRVQVIQY